MTQSSHSQTSEIRQARLDWLSTLDEQSAPHEILFRIEMYLVAIDRFIRPGELPILGRGDPISGYKSELMICLRLLSRALNACRTMQSHDSTQFVLFRRFVEQSVLGDAIRDKRWTDQFNQNVPSESFVLLDGMLAHLLQVGKGLAKGPEIDPPSFFSFGAVLKSSLYANKFFNPFDARGFSDLYDSIDNPAVLSAVQKCQDGATRRAAALLILSVMRVLRYLQYIDTSSKLLQDLQDTLPIFALVRSDIDAMLPLFKRQVPELLAGLDHPQAQKLKELTDSIVFQFELEGRKVFLHVLAEATDLRSSEPLHIAAETAHGILRNFAQQSIVWIVQALDPQLQGHDIFEDFKSRQQQSMQLRNDLNALVQVLDAAQVKLVDAHGDKPRLRESLKHFLQYFMAGAVRHARAPDLASFQEMSRSLCELCDEPWVEDSMIAKTRMELHKHRIFADTTLQCVAQRADLQEVVFDPVQSDQIVQQYFNVHSAQEEENV